MKGGWPNDPSFNLPAGGGGEIVLTDGPLGLQANDLRFKPFWARISGSPSGSAYPWVQVLETDTSFPDDTAPGFGRSGTTSVLPAREVNGLTTVATGTKVQLWLSPTMQYYLFDGSAGSANPVFVARLTTSSSGAWKWYRQKVDSGGSWVDDGGEAASFNAYPSTVDGSDACNPVAGLRVVMWAGVTSGKYEFLPYGYTDSTHPGLVSLAAQTMGDGDKTFQADVFVQGSIQVDVYADVGDNTVLRNHLGVGGDIYVTDVSSGWPGTPTHAPPETIIEQAQITLTTLDVGGGTGSEWVFNPPTDSPPLLTVEIFPAPGDADYPTFVLRSTVGPRYSIEYLTAPLTYTRFDGVTQTRAGFDVLGGIAVAVKTKPTVTGSRGGNAALASLLTALASSPLDLITDSTT